MLLYLKKLEPLISIIRQVIYTNHKGVNMYSTLYFLLAKYTKIF